MLIANEMKFDFTNMLMQIYDTYDVWLRRHHSWISSKEFTEFLFTNYNVVYGTLPDIITERLETKCVGPNSEAIAFEDVQGHVVYKLRSLATNADTKAATQLASKRQKRERAAELRQRARVYMCRADALDPQRGPTMEDFDFLIEEIEH